MRQAGRGPPKHPDGGMGNSMQQQQQHLHGMFDDNGLRSMGMPSSRGAPHPHNPSHAGMSAPHSNMLTVMGELPEPHSPAAAAAAVAAAAVDGNWQQGGPPPPMPGDGGDMNRSVNPVDIGIKVANEIMGLHSQAAATGRALEESTRQAEFLQEENERLKEELERVHQARQASDDEAARLKAKLSQRSIELLVLEQKVQAAEERTEAQAQKTAEQAESTVAANERYDALVSRLMVVVVKASVAAEQLEKAMLSANKTPGMRCNCKPALHHGLDALTSLADFRDTWMSGSTMNLNMPYSSNSSSNSPAAAAAAQSAAGSPRVAASSSMRRNVMGKESGSCMDARPIRASNSGADSPLRPGSGSSSPMSRHANSMRASLSAAGELTRQVMLRPAGGSGELERGRQSSGLRPASSGEIRSSHRAAEAQLRSCEVPRLHLAMMQQQEQQQRAARESSGCYDSPRRMVGRSGISLAGGGSGTSSPRRSPACLSKTEALEAAADLVYGTLVREQHQHQQLRQPMSPSRSPTAARQPPPPWNSDGGGGGGSLPRRFSQAANPPSSPSKVGSQRRTVYFEDDRRGPVVYEPDEYEDAYEEDFDDYLVPSGGPQLAPDRSCMSGWY